MTLVANVLTALIFIAKTFAYNQLNSNVTQLTASNIYNLVNDGNIWVVYCYTSKTKKDEDFTREFGLSAGALKGTVKFGAIDIEDHLEFGKNFTINIKSLPVVNIYGVSNDGTPKTYKGKKTAKDLTEALLKHISKRAKKQLGKQSAENNVEEINDSNFDKVITNSKDPWLVFFYAPWCIHCKEFKPIWKSLAFTLKGKTKCAAIDATTNPKIARENQIKQYPTLKLFLFDKKSSQRVYDYALDRTVDSVTSWVLEKLPGPDIVQLTNAEVFRRHCMMRNLCIINILPSIFDCQADCRNKYLNILEQLGEKHKQKDWGWIWTDAGSQKDLENALNIGGSGYPSLVVLNTIKMKYSVFKGAFTKSNINEFLLDLAKVNAIDVDGDVATKIASVTAWDGKDSANELPNELYLHDSEFKKDEL